MILIFIMIFNFSNKIWLTDDKIIYSDVNSYYAYLPALFIHHDISLEFIKEDVNKHTKHFWPLPTATGKNAILTSMGMAYLYLPFFIIAHIVTPFLGYEADGFSIPYKVAIVIGCWVYLAIGLYFLRKFLENYFKQIVIAITSIAIVIGTNLLYYTTLDAGMSHTYSFTLFAIFLFLTVRWYKNPGLLNTSYIGMVLGLISLVRPSNIIILALIIFWGITTWAGLLERVKFFIGKYYLIILMVFFFFLVWAPQFLYWKYISGSFLFNTYGTVGARFYFDDPEITNTLFSYRKGWLIYTPIMTLALIGIGFLYQRIRQAFFPILIFTLLNIWVIASWWCWWYGGSYGQRTFIESYAILALPFATITSWFFKKKILLKVIYIILILIFSAHNIFQVIQYRNGAIHYAMMTKEAYWSSFLKVYPETEFWELITWPDYEGAKKGEYKENRPVIFDRSTYEKEIEYYENRLRNSEDLQPMLKEKAEKWGISIDSVIKMDAIWLYNHNKNKSE